MDFLVNILRNRNNQMTQKKIFLITCVLIVFLLFVFFYPGGHTGGKARRSRRTHLRGSLRTKYLDNQEQPITYSKSDHLNRTLKVPKCAISSANV